METVTSRWTGQHHVSPIKLPFFLPLIMFHKAVTMDDDLAPLERARRRKNMLTGPRP